MFGTPSLMGEDSKGRVLSQSRSKKSSKLSKEGEVYNVQRSTASFNLEITTTPERNDSTPDIIEQ